MMSCNIHNARREAVRRNALKSERARHEVDEYIARRRREQHNAKVEAALDAANAGAVVNLTELLISREEVA